MAAQLVVAQSLLTNLERGAPFISELTALKNLGVTPDKLAPLAAGADKGLPTPAALAASLKKLSASMIATGAPAPAIPAQQSWLDRIATSASSLVKIRRDGDPANDDIAGKLAAMDGALAKGDVATAVATWDKLPVSAQTLSQDWVNQAKTRIASVQTAHALVDEAIAGLGSKKP